MDLPCIATSAKDNYNIKNAIHTILQNCKGKREKDSVAYGPPPSNLIEQQRQVPNYGACMCK